MGCQRAGHPPNQLASMNFGANSFQYDAYGRRVSKTISSATTNYLYDGSNMVQELSGTTPTANLLTGGIDEVFTRSDSSGTANFLTQALGSTMALTDSAGNSLAQYAYEPFGNTTVTSGSSTNSYEYTGREYDGTGLYFHRARYYNPSLQRFVSEDPIGFRGGQADLYAYVGDSPENFIDPTGMDGYTCIVSTGAIGICDTVTDRHWYTPCMDGRKCGDTPQDPQTTQDTLAANNGTPSVTPVVQRDNGKSKPNVPPEWGFCSGYRDGTGAGDAMYHLCMSFPNGPWSNCVRGNLLNQWTPNGNPLDLSIYLFGCSWSSRKDH